MPRITNITFRKGTSTEWSITNPILAAGEPGYDTTIQQLKIGDGVNTWNSLVSIGDRQTYRSVGNTGTTQTISINNGIVQNYTLTGNCSFTMPAPVSGLSFTIFLNTGTGGFTATFVGVRWSGGTPPSITTLSNRVDVFRFISDGTSWYGERSQNYTCTMTITGVSGNSCGRYTRCDGTIINFSLVPGTNTIFDCVQSNSVIIPAIPCAPVSYTAITFNGGC